MANWLLLWIFSLWIWMDNICFSRNCWNTNFISLPLSRSFAHLLAVLDVCLPDDKEINGLQSPSPLPHHLLFSFPTQTLLTFFSTFLLPPDLNLSSFSCFLFSALPPSTFLPLFSFSHFSVLFLCLPIFFSFDLPHPDISCKRVFRK